MKFIKLTRHRSEATIWLVSSKIESIEQAFHNYSDEPPSSTITTDSKDIFEVKENPEEIFQLIKGCHENRTRSF